MGRESMLGKLARQIRESHGFNQKEAADKLDITVVHLCNIENDKSKPSPELVKRFRKEWGIDLYVLAWCLNGDIEKLPQSIRKPAAALAKAWCKQLSIDSESFSKCSNSED
jgi:transcriptional regulator with XRE-family HTH domain